METTDFSTAYRRLLKSLVDIGTTETNERTGSKITMLEGGYSFKIGLGNGLLPVAGNRKYWPHIAAAETAWQFMGTKDPSFIVNHAPKLWSKFVVDDELETSYGYRWRKHFERDQICMAVDALKNDPTNRQLYISAWDPASDGLGAPNQPPNIPCPVGFSLTKSKDRLHMSLFIRSSDVFVGLPYDVMSYALTLDAIASAVGCSPGTMHITLAHPHFYEAHKKAVQDNVAMSGTRRAWTNNVQPHLPAWSIYEIVNNPDQYVSYMKRLASRVGSSSHDPKPELVV